MNVVLLLVCKFVMFLCLFSLLKPLRKALKTISSTVEPLQESSLTTSLCTALQHGLETLHDLPSEETAAALFENLFNKISIPLVNQVYIVLQHTCYESTILVLNFTLA